MDELESQIAKIQLGGGKHASSYVFTLAEKIGRAELYIVAELPLLNPAAEESCEKICLAIASTLKRALARPIGEETFENAIAATNEELGKLASMGQTHWIDKLNCIIAVKENSGFTIASCGKVAAYLLRNKEFTDISCSSSLESHPLKTFENYASGKIRLGDLLILSTTQLFNHISMDRLRDIVTQNSFLNATQTIIELLKENGGPEVAFGSLLNLQVAPGEVSDEEVDLESYVAETPQQQIGLVGKTLDYIKAALTMDKARVPKVGLPKISLEQIKNIGGNAKNLASKSKSAWNALGKGVAAGKKTLDLENFRKLSPQKKFFLISAGLLLLAFFVNLAIASHYKTTKQAQTQVASQLQEVQNLLGNAEASLLYKDDAKAADFLGQAQSKIPAESTVPAASKNLYAEVKKRFADLQQKIEKVSQSAVTNLGSLSEASLLIKLPPFLATQSGTTIISYNTASGLVQDGALLSSETVVENAFIKNNASVVYNGKSLLVWDYAKKQFSPAFNLSVPLQDSYAGLKFYPTNSRVYLANKKSGQVLSFLVGSNGLSKPVVAVAGADLSTAQDVAVDGNVYVLNSGGILKYLGGKPADFKMPYSATAFAGSGRLFTDASSKNIYLLDKGGNRILVMDKKGVLVETLKSPEFTHLKDFSVDEKNKVIYVLNDVSLLKVSLP